MYAAANVKGPAGGVINDDTVSDINTGLYQQDYWLIQNSGSHMLDIVVLQEILNGAKSYFAILEKAPAVVVTWVTRKRKSNGQNGLVVQGYRPRAKGEPAASGCQVSAGMHLGS